MRMISIHLTLNVMFFITLNPEKNKLLNQAFFMSLIFILKIVKAYRRFLKKFVSFKYKKQDD